MASPQLATGRNAGAHERPPRAQAVWKTLGGRVANATLSSLFIFRTLIKPILAARPANTGRATHDDSAFSPDTGAHIRACARSSLLHLSGRRSPAASPALPPARRRKFHTRGLPVALKATSSQSARQPCTLAPIAQAYWTKVMAETAAMTSASMAVVPGNSGRTACGKRRPQAEAAFQSVLMSIARERIQRNG